MNEQHRPGQSTRRALLHAGRELFAERGYRGASVRAITGRAQANLGAVTYHYGSKANLYQAVLEETLSPFRETLRAAASREGVPLERVERFVRAFFEHLFEHPELRALLLRELSSSDPLPPPVLRTFRANFGLLTRLIEDGQEVGAIRSGDAALLALATGTQPVALTLVRPVLEQAGAVRFDDEAMRARLVDSAVRFVRAGLAKTSPTEDVAS